jgi:hypothetical protein
MTARDVGCRCSEGARAVGCRAVHRAADRQIDTDETALGGLLEGRVARADTRSDAPVPSSVQGGER